MTLALIASMLRYGLSILLLAGGCVERVDCPPGERCSTRTPYGLHFGELLPMAVGGTRTVRFSYGEAPDADSAGSLQPFDLPYLAAIEGTSAVVEETRTSEVILRSVHAGTDVLRIVDPGDGSLYDRVDVEGLPLASVKLVHVGLDANFDDDPVSWWPVPTEIGVSLLGAGGEEIVDTSAQLALVGGESVTWNTVRLTDASLGHHELTVSAGDRSPQVIDVQVVDHIETIEMDDRIYPILGGRGHLCFKAMTESRFVANAPWNFESSAGVLSREGDHNCVDISVSQPAGGSVTVVAIAGNANRLFSVPIE